MKTICNRKLLPKLIITFLFCTMLFFPLISANAYTYTITITLHATSHGGKIPIDVSIETNEDVESFRSWRIDIFRHGAKVDTLSFTYSENINVVGQGATYTSSFTIEDKSADQQILTFNCYVYDKDGNEVGSGSAEKEPPINHDYTHVMTLDRTCTEAGYKVDLCNTCQYYNYTETASALGHLLSCAHDSSTSNDQSKHITKCTRAGCTYEEQSACNFVETTIPAGCEKGERHIHACSVCNYSYTLETTSPLDHAYSVSQIMPTCTSEGYVLHTCSRCKISYTSDATAALDHNFQSDFARDVSPTCISAGLEAYTCSRTGCGEHKDSILAALGHDYTNATSNPTCTTEGYTTYTCSRCTDTYISDAAPAFGHDYQRDSVRDVAPTCTSAGLEAHTCSRCGAHDDVALALRRHDYLPAVTEPACTTEGYTTYTCARCGNSYMDNHTKKRGHRMNEWIPLGNGTHTADCAREGCSYKRSALCSSQKYFVDGAEFTLCPICGETSTGECLKLIQGISAKAITYTLPNGNLIVRVGALPNGTMFATVAFVQSDDLQQPEGKVRFTLPVETFEGYSLKLVNSDGSLIDVPAIITEDRLSFELDYTSFPYLASLPSALIQLCPIADEAVRIGFPILSF